MTKQTIAIASDHAGFTLKELLRPKLEKAGYTVVDLGTDSEASTDYPDYANKMANWLKTREKSDKGILICGSGIGISIAANRHPHVRALLCHNDLEAKMSRQHNDANVICFAGREEFHDNKPLAEVADVAMRWVHIFMTTELDQSNPRHANRVAKLGCSGPNPV